MGIGCPAAGVETYDIRFCKYMFGVFNVFVVCYALCVPCVFRRFRGVKDDHNLLHHSQHVKNTLLDK